MQFSKCFYEFLKYHWVWHLMIHFIAIAIFDAGPKQWSANENEEFVPQPNLQIVALPSEWKIHENSSFQICVKQQDQIRHNMAQSGKMWHMVSAKIWKKLQAHDDCNSLPLPFIVSLQAPQNVTSHETWYILKGHCDFLIQTFKIRGGSAVSGWDVLNTLECTAFPCFRIEFVRGSWVVPWDVHCLSVYFLPSLSIVFLASSGCLPFLSSSYFSFCPAQLSLPRLTLLFRPYQRKFSLETSELRSFNTTTSLTSHFASHITFHSHHTSHHITNMSHHVSPTSLTSHMLHHSHHAHLT